MSYIEKSSDEEDGIDRGSINGSDDYDDVSDFCDNEDNLDGTDDDDDEEYSSDKKLVDTGCKISLSSLKIHRRSARITNEIKKRTNSTLAKTINPTKVIVDNNPDNRVRSVAKGPLHNETLFEFDMRCLLKYKELYGHITIKRGFTVPWNDNWPEEMWDLRLGNKLNNIRMMKLHRDKKEELTAIGVCYEEQIPLRNYGWDNISLALKTYKAINGHILIPQKFIIPTESTVWPENLSGMRLGSISQGIKYYNTHSTHRDEILAMGIKYAGKLSVR